MESKRQIHQHQREDLNYEILHQFPGGVNTEKGYNSSMSMNKEGRYCYPANNLVVLRYVQPHKQNQLDIFDQHKFNVSAVKFNQKGNWVISADQNGNVIVWYYIYIHIYYIHINILYFIIISQPQKYPSFYSL